MLARIISFLFVIIALSGQTKPIDLFDKSSSKGPAEEGPAEITVSSMEGVVDSGAGVYGEPIVLTFDRGTGGILVPAVVNGKKAYFVFDTGATLTSITPAFVDYIGESIRADSPSSSFSTANGVVNMKLGIISRLKLGNENHNGVTFAVCAGCQPAFHNGAPIAGLLGLNVIGRYRVQYNDAEGKIEMYPNKDHANRRRDVEPFLHLSDWNVDSKGKIIGSVRVTNRSTRNMKNLALQFQCGASSTTAKAASIGRKKSKKIKFSMTNSGRCNVRPSIAAVDW